MVQKTVTIEATVKADVDDYFDHSKHRASNNNDSCNGSSPKNLTTDDCTFDCHEFSDTADTGIQEGETGDTQAGEAHL